MITEPVLITLITVVGGGILTILATLVAKISHVGRRVNQVGKDATIAREQTQNSHKSNLRDNIDKNHGEMLEMFKLVRDEISALRNSDTELHNSDTSLWDAINKLRRL